MPSFDYYAKNDTLVELQGVKDATTGNFLQSGSVTMDIENVSGTVIQSGISFSHVTGTSTSGTWRATIKDDAGLTEGNTFKAKITFSGTGTNQKAFWQLDINSIARDQ